MKQRTPETTYQLTFIPQGEETIVDQKTAQAFERKLHSQFGIAGHTEKNILIDHQSVVHLTVEWKNIREIVRFMQKKGFGEEVAKMWWLNTIQSFNPWSMVTGINTPTIPVSDWIQELPH